MDSLLISQMRKSLGLIYMASIATLHTVVLKILQDQLIRSFGIS